MTLLYGEKKLELFISFETEYHGIYRDGWKLRVSFFCFSFEVCID